VIVLIRPEFKHISSAVDLAKLLGVLRAILRDSLFCVLIFVLLNVKRLLRAWQPCVPTECACLLNRL